MKISFNFIAASTAKGFNNRTFIWGAVFLQSKKGLIIKNVTILIYSMELVVVIYGSFENYVHKLGLWENDSEAYSLRT